MLLYVARHADGDILAMQPVIPIGGVAGERIDLLDLRGTNRRILDAEIDVVVAPDATTAAVAATIGESFATDAERLIFTGVRACRAD